MDDFLLMDVDVFCPGRLVDICGCNTEMENTCSSKCTQLLTLENVFLPIVPKLVLFKDDSCGYNFSAAAVRALRKGWKAEEHDLMARWGQFSPVLFIIGCLQN